MIEPRVAELGDGFVDSWWEVSHLITFSELTRDVQVHEPSP